MNFDNLLELWAFWLINKECISARDAAGLHAVEVGHAGECKGIKKTGSANLFISDEMQRLKRIYLEDLTALQRKAIALEFGLSGRTLNRAKTSTERRRLSDAKKAMYFQFAKPHRKVLDSRPSALVFFV